MEMTLSEKLTYSTVRLVCSNEKGELSLGTGFIMSLCQRDGKNVPVIITNYHVVKGCNTFEFEFCLRAEDGKPDDLHVENIKLNNVGWIHHPNINVLYVIRNRLFTNSRKYRWAISHGRSCYDWISNWFDR